MVGIRGWQFPTSEPTQEEERAILCVFKIFPSCQIPAVALPPGMHNWTKQKEMNTEILVLQLGLHKASENVLVSPPAMLFTQLGLQEAVINSLSGSHLMFNNTTK